MSTPKPQDLLDSIADAAGREVAKLILGMRDEINEAIRDAGATVTVATNEEGDR